MRAGDLVLGDECLRRCEELGVDAYTSKDLHQVLAGCRRAVVTGVDAGEVVAGESTLEPVRDYSDLLERLWHDHKGATAIYQFDIGFNETVRRHQTRDLRDAFGADEMREWYDGWKPLPWIDEHRIGPDASVTHCEPDPRGVSAGRPLAGFKDLRFGAYG
ncbi:hypothetical protein [Microbacterium hydrocarbonoxydans]|nr:hypothetical protein [Microbacterium hydrocarbonoxydans]MCM3779688.1 hypothetical protein [Microbacterium hydrocarbonoxydans]